MGWALSLSLMNVLLHTLVSLPSYYKAFLHLTVSGPTSNSAFFSHIAKAIPEDPSITFHQSHFPLASQVNVNYISRPPSPPPLSPEKLRSANRSGSVNDVYALPPKSRIVQLVNLFFAEIGMLFPYIYKKNVLEGLTEMKLTHFYGVRRSWLCILNTIMAFATCLATVPNDSLDIAAAEADVFLQRALKLLPNITFKPANLEMRKLSNSWLFS